MKNNKIVLLFLIASITFVLFGCSSSKSNASNESILEKNATYIGKNATNEIIKVDSNDSWTIKSQSKDDSNYSVVTVSKTDEKVEKYPVIKLVVNKVSGDINSVFAKREGRNFIVVKDGNEVYFRSISDDNRKSITDKMKQVKDPDEYIKEISNYVFTKQ